MDAWEKIKDRSRRNHEIALLAEKAENPFTRWLLASAYRWDEWVRTDLGCRAWPFMGIWHRLIDGELF